MSDNPFEPVSSDPPPVAPEPQIVFASQNKRFLNFIVDTLCFYVCMFVLGIGLGVAMVAGGLSEEAMALIANVIGIPAFLAYFVVLESLGGKTVGKLLTGTRVIRNDGGSPTFLQILGRTAARMIPFEPFSFLFGDNTTGWHDSLSGTRVIDERATARRQ